MMKKTFLLSLLLLVLGTSALHAQQEEDLGVALKTQESTEKQDDNKKAKKDKLKKPKKFYDPKIASKRSAIIPGWGQIYNDSWWKVPILYGGFGLAIYYIDFNNQQRLKWENLVTELVSIRDDPDNPQPIDENALRVYRRRADNWRKNRDLLYLVTVGIYVLNIAEAAIDAHLKGFDVSENLGLNLKPKLGVINNGSPYLGIGLTLPIGSK